MNSELSVTENVQSKSPNKQGMHDFYLSQFTNSNNVALLNRAPIEPEKQDTSLIHNISPDLSSFPSHLL